MTDLLEPLRHHSYVADDDDLLAREASQHLAKLPSLQIVCELMLELRRAEPAWWHPEALRAAWPANTRLSWLNQRADVRQRITTVLTGLPPRAARKKSAAFQAELIDACVDEGDVDVRTFEHAFSPQDMTVYGPAEDFWHAFRGQLPIEQDTPELQRFSGWLIRTLLASKGVDGHKRVPVLTPLAVRTAIDGRVWHSRMPLDIRVAIDDARFRQERQRPGKPFCARHDLAIALPEHIAAHIPLSELEDVLNRAEAAMGFQSQGQQELLPLTFAPRSMGPIASFAPSMAPDGESPIGDVQSGQAQAGEPSQAPRTDPSQLTQAGAEGEPWSGNRHVA